MKRSTAILAGLLLLQLAVLVMVRFDTSGDSAATRSRPVLGLKAGEIVRVEIAGKSSLTEKRVETVVLERKGDQWSLSSAGGYPVSAKRGGELASKLAALAAAAPVSTKKTHRAALEVGKDKFQRRVTLTLASGKTRVFFVGKSAGFKRAHVRLAGKDEIYAAKEINSWDLGTNASSWIDTTYLKLDRARMAAVTLKNAKGEIALVKAEGKWALKKAADASQPAGDVSKEPSKGDATKPSKGAQSSTTPTLDQSKVDGLMGTLAFLTLRDPVGNRIEASYGLDTPAAEVLIELAADPKSVAGDKKPLRYRLRVGALTKDGASRYAKRDGSAFVVTIDSSTADELVKKTLADLLPSKKKEE
jgi:hypothetical protein